MPPVVKGRKRGLEEVQELAREALTCGICLELIFPPVQQCSEGHQICDSCLAKLPCEARGCRRCPTCRTAFPSKRLRNLLADQMAELLEYPCQYKENGCDIVLAPSKMKEHIKICTFNPKRMCCPLPNCSWSGLVCDFQSHMENTSKLTSSGGMDWMTHMSALPMNSRGQTGTQLEVRSKDEIWLDGQLESQQIGCWKDQGPNVLVFRDAVFITHAKLVGGMVKIGICWASQKLTSPDFTYRINVQNNETREEVQRSGLARMLPTSKDELFQSTKCLAVDWETARSLATPQKSIFGQHPSDVLTVSFTISRIEEAN